MGIDIDNIKEIIKDHMLLQPYKITCEDCGENIEVGSVELDTDMDLVMTVYPCKNCNKIP